MIPYSRRKALDILLDAGELEQKVPYDDLVTTTYAKNAVTKFE